MRIALGLEYDGRDFLGWQSQPQGNTVQDVLEKALAEIAGESMRTVCAGRTDAGVHALVQVAHFNTLAKRPESAWVRGVNTLLPKGVAVRWAREVSEDFNARYSAMARSYRYILYNHSVRPALMHGKVGWFHAPLDEERMREATQYLLGQHDFSAFRAAECQAKTPVKTLHRADVVRYGDYLVFEFRANAFLHHMVRNMVGALIYVGKGRYTPEWMGEMLLSGNREHATPTFSAHGLYLSGIEYPSHWSLPENGRIIAPFFFPVS